MASYALMCERRKAITQKKRPEMDSSQLVDRLPIRQGKRFSMFN